MKRKWKPGEDNTHFDRESNIAGKVEDFAADANLRASAAPYDTDAQRVEIEANQLQFEDLRRELLPYARRAGWTTDEDVFNEVS